MKRAVRLVARELLYAAAILLPLLVAAHFTHPAAGRAYVGPGAGFAFLGSFLSILMALFLSVLALLAWPFRLAWRALRRRRFARRAKVEKVIFLGFDGVDPRLVEQYMQAGKLPNLRSLREQGSFQKLRTTFPSLSPVAWSTFATGVSPAKHNIFDFLNRSLKSYVPELSSSRVSPPRRWLRLGRWRLPLGGVRVELRRKSRPFWTILGESDVDCTVLRIPVTFPPDKFSGRMLSAMCTPDLKGTQGSFSEFSTATARPDFESGDRFPLIRRGRVLTGRLEGPGDTFVAEGPPLAIPFTLEPTGPGRASLRIQKHTLKLALGEYTDWIRLKFRTAVGIQVPGIVRFLLTETEPEVRLYATPIQIDPENPALPISHPPYYAAYLAKLLGCFATLGLAEDTWALNEGVIDEKAFLDQVYLTQAEREAMLFSALERTRRGVVACVFDATDRVQHMFYRYIDPERETSPKGGFDDAIEQIYRRMDEVVGKVLAHVNAGTLLFVLSDHGFCSFRRGVNLNSWLLENGYLTLKDGATESGRYFQGVDWSRTRAYTFGLGGLYLNIKGREALGTVAPGREADLLTRELIDKLQSLTDPETGRPVMHDVYATRSLYKGPYLDAAPDLITGYAAGYRISWDAAVGRATGQVVEANDKAWSGDHSVDPHLVPGVLFCNRPLQAEDPGIEDLAPTALDAFGVPRPAWMEGKSIYPQPVV
ncbi:MAG: alkaline phosphatase family protein [Bryobacterales bacterium]|nr:alkaline phosphatase family protein [Bryobacterales bacterium]